MAKRISEQQDEIDTLREQLLYHAARHSEMYDVMKFINDKINSLKIVNFKIGTDDENKLNLSGELIESIDMNESKDSLNLKEKEIKKIGSEEDKIILALKNENTELRKELEMAKAQNTSKDIEINKLTTDRFILFTELNELVASLKRVDLNLLNDFYIKNAPISINKKRDPRSSLSSNDILSSMGIKYNILSAQSELSLLTNKNEDNKKLLKTNIIINKNSEEKNTPENIFIQNLSSNPNKINIEKYSKLVLSYENELNSKAIERPSDCSTSHQTRRTTYSEI